MESNLKRIGDYIEQTDIRNENLSVNTLLGVSIEKKFIPSIANTVGTDFTKYKVVEKGQFAYGPVTSRNGDKLSIALLKDYDKCIISSSYIPFRITKPNELNAEYLMLIFSNPEFDRYARYNSWGSAREIFSWEELCDTKISIPDIKEQEKIVREYNTITKRIDILNQINDNLFNQSAVIYRNLFGNVNEQEDFIGNYMIPKRGKNLLLKEVIDGNVPVVAGGVDASGYHNIANTSAPVITISASGANAGYVNLWNIPVWSSDSSYIDNTITSNIFFWYVTLKIRQKEIYDFQTGSAQPHIYPQHIAELPIMKLKDNDIEKFENTVSPIFNRIGQNKQEINVLKQILLVLSSKIS